MCPLYVYVLHIYTMINVFPTTIPVFPIFQVPPRGSFVEVGIMMDYDFPLLI